MSNLFYLSVDPIIINTPTILTLIIPPIITIIFANKFIEKNSVSFSTKLAIFGFTISHLMSLMVFYSYYYFIIAVAFSAFFNPFIVNTKTQLSATWFS